MIDQYIYLYKDQVTIKVNMIPVIDCMQPYVILRHTLCMAICSANLALCNYLRTAVSVRSLPLVKSQLTLISRKCSVINRYIYMYPWKCTTCIYMLCIYMLCVLNIFLYIDRSYNLRVHACGLSLRRIDRIISVICTQKNLTAGYSFSGAHTGTYTHARAHAHI